MLQKSGKYPKQSPSVKADGVSSTNWTATGRCSCGSQQGFHVCPFDGACPGGTVNGSSRDTQCISGHGGLLCQECTGGLVKRFGDTCSECGENEGVIVLAGSLSGLALFFLLAGLAWKACMRGKRKAAAKEAMHKFRAGWQRRMIAFRTFFGFVQVVSRMSVTYRFTFPPKVQELFDALSFFEYLDFFSVAMRPGCLFQPNFYTRLYTKTLTPLGVLFAIYAAYRCSKSLTTKGWLFDVMFLISFIVFPSLCNTLFSALDCRMYEDGVRGLARHLNSPGN